MAVLDAGELELELVRSAWEAFVDDDSHARELPRMAYMNLEEYRTAKAALEAGAKLNPGDSRFKKLIKECDDCIAEENSDLPT